MNYKNEQTILKIIKFTPPIFIVSISLLLILFLYMEYKNSYNQEKLIIEKEFIEINKKVIKQNVNTVYNTIIELQKNTESKLKESIKERVYEAHTIATKIYNENKHKDKNTIIKMIKDALVDIRFNNGRGYFYIYSMDFECILFPLKRSIEGSNFYNFKDGKGKYLTRDIIAQIKKENEGFMSWHFYKPNDKNTSYRKIGFNKYFAPLNWYIGTGEYLDDFEQDVKKQALDYIKILKYVDNNYIFVLNYDGTYLQHIKKDIIGKNGLVINGKNSANDVKNSKNILSKSINLAKTKGEGFLTYTQNKKFGTKKAIEKTSYIKAIDNWNWFIGQGFYYDSFYKNLEYKKTALEKKFHNYIENVIIFGVLLMLVLLFISVYISRTIQNKFNNYKKEIEEHILKNNEQGIILAQQSKMSALGEMIGNIAHQWRQPLNSISSAATGMEIKADFDDLSKEDIKNFSNSIYKNTLYLSKTIDTFRDFIKGEKVLKQIPLQDEIIQTKNIEELVFKNKHIKFIDNVDYDDLIIANITTGELPQVLINILNNAKDILIERKIQTPWVKLNLQQENNDALITIEDNGKGVSEDIINRIFEPYFTTKHQSFGTGLGLHMSYKIVTESLKGDIWVENTKNGAKFFIKIPLNKK